MNFGSTFKHSSFGRGASEITSRNGQPLELAQIAQSCPSVLATEAHSSRSQRYTYISTMSILEGLAKEGFHPHSIMQGGSKFEHKRGFTKHLIRLRSEAPAKSVRGSVYEVCLLNSHDGTTSQKMFGGFFRFACKNGSIFFDGEATEVKVQHTGNVLDQVIEGAYHVVGQAKLASEHVENFQALRLNRDEQMAFAASAAQLRFEEESPVTPAQLLIPRRTEDRADDLWTTFNRVQENVVRGGIGYTHTARDQATGLVRETHRTTRAVRSVDGDVKLNRALWVLAEEMAKLKA
jgi:hypothetical protein